MSTFNPYHPFNDILAEDLGGPTRAAKLDAVADPVERNAVDRLLSALDEFQRIGLDVQSFARQYQLNFEGDPAEVFGGHHDVLGPAYWETKVKVFCRGLTAMGKRASSAASDGFRANKKQLAAGFSQVREARQVRYGEDDIDAFLREFNRQTGLRAVVSDPDSTFEEASSTWAVDLFSPKGSIYLGGFEVIVYQPSYAQKPGWNISSFPSQEGRRELAAAVDKAISAAFK